MLCFLAFFFPCCKWGLLVWIYHLNPIEKNGTYLKSHQLSQILHNRRNQKGSKHRSLRFDSVQLSHMFWMATYLKDPRQKRVDANTNILEDWGIPLKIPFVKGKLYIAMRFHTLAFCSTRRELWLKGTWQAISLSVYRAPVFLTG